MKVDDFKSYLRGLLADHPAVTVEEWNYPQERPLSNLKITDSDGRSWFTSIVTAAPPGGDGNRHAEPKEQPGVELIRRSDAT